MYLVEGDIEKCVSNFNSKLRCLRDLIVSFNDKLYYSKLVMAPITGMDLTSYNGSKSLNIDNQQALLNQSVINVNTEIARFNRLNNVFTPWTSRIVHHRHRQKYHARYEKLSDDGCHLSDEILQYWAQSLRRS